jgi:hypothetical protein
MVFGAPNNALSLHIASQACARRVRIPSMSGAIAAPAPDRVFARAVFPLCINPKEFS